MARSPGLPSIAILATPFSTASVIYGMYDLFRSAGRDWDLVVRGAPGPELLAPAIVARSESAFTLANGVRVTPEAALRARDRYDVVVVPELALSPEESIAGRFLPELSWLRAQHRRGALLCAACSGTVLLAEAGLLNGHEATTHWAYCDALARNYPRVSVQRERALVVTGEGHRLVMAGGGTSWLDLGLYLIARTLDLESAVQVARLNLIDWHADGQQPFARIARTRQVDDAVIGRAQAWIGKHFAASAPVASMVRLSGLPERTFKRRFQTATGMAPLAYVHALRIEEAKRRLERGSEPLERIALEVGYEDATFFTRLFRRQVGLTAADYRKKFGGLRTALSRAR
jgi:transcriptional regulator GlxA family with amidase domain